MNPRDRKTNKKRKKRKAAGLIRKERRKRQKNEVETYKLKRIAELAIELQNLVQAIGEKREDSLMQLSEVDAIGNWWIEENRKVSPRDHQYRVAGKKAYMVVMERGAIKEGAEKDAFEKKHS